LRHLLEQEIGGELFLNWHSSPSAEAARALIQFALKSYQLGADRHLWLLAAALNSHLILEEEVHGYLPTLNFGKKHKSKAYGDLYDLILTSIHDVDTFGNDELLNVLQGLRSILNEKPE